MPPRAGDLIDMGSALHDKAVEHWFQEAKKSSEHSRRLLTRFEAARELRAQRKLRAGDRICEQMRDIFMHGLDVKWSDDQISVFEAFQNTCLPLIYGDAWNEEKARVMRERGLKKENPYALINMARRNGKTFSVSGAAAALVLALPACKVAIFSTCRRTSQMMLQALLDHFDRAFRKGTHVKEQDFLVLAKNAESVVYQGPDGSRRVVGSFPQSVRVSEILSSAAA